MTWVLKNQLQQLPGEGSYTISYTMYKVHKKLIKLGQLQQPPGE